MADQERELVNRLNNHYRENDINAIAYRRKQHKYTGQQLDILVDSKNPKHYLGIECKSIKTNKGQKKLYFSQHFSKNQVKEIQRFLELSGRTGALAVQLRRGRGKKKINKIIPWHIVYKRFCDSGTGFSVAEIRKEYPSVGLLLKYGARWCDS